MPVSTATRTRREYLAFVVDLLMFFLVIIDLFWLAFDALFEVRYLRELMMDFMPDFTQFYADVVHPNFLFFDSFVILVFVMEFFLRWAWAVWTRKHRFWFVYPLLHWYDILGCIPTGTFRILRLLRIFALIARLHNWGVIDVRRFALVRLGIRYYNIAVEEVADRVAVRILEETKQELQRGKHLVDEIVDVVIRPRKEQIISESTERLQSTIRVYYQTHKKDIQSYIATVVRQAVSKNKEVANLEKIPVFGTYLKDSLRQAVSDIVGGVLDRLLEDFADERRSEATATALRALAEIMLTTPAIDDEGDPVPSLASEVVNHAIDIIIQRVDIKQWKIEMDKENEARKG